MLQASRACFDAGGLSADRMVYAETLTPTPRPKPNLSPNPTPVLTLTPTLTPTPTPTPNLAPNPIPHPHQVYTETRKALPPDALAAFKAAIAKPKP